MEPIKILVVDDHIVVRTGLRSLLSTQPDIIVVAEANNGAEALEQAREHKPDVVIMDITMPVMDGIEATEKLHEADAKCHVLALTVHEDKQFFYKMMAAGASGYISKQAASQDLIDAIRTVAAGNIYMQPEHAGWLVEEYRDLARRSSPRPPAGHPLADGPDLNSLSQREIEVVELVAEGLTTPEIAEKLELSPKTVSRHRERIMQKLNLHSTIDLVKFAIQTGLTRID